MEHPNESAQGLAAYIDRNTSSIHPQKHKNSSKLKRVTYKSIDTNQKTRPQNPIQDRRINLSTLDLNASSPTSKMDSSKTKTRERHVTSKVRISKYKGHKVRMTCLSHVACKVQISKYKGHKVRMTCLRHVACKVRISKYKGHKVRMTCLRHVACKVRIPSKYKGHKVQMSCLQQRAGGKYDTKKPQQHGLVHHTIRRSLPHRQQNGLVHQIT